MVVHTSVSVSSHTLQVRLASKFEIHVEFSPLCVRLSFLVRQKASKVRLSPAVFHAFARDKLALPSFISAALLRVDLPLSCLCFLCLERVESIFISVSHHFLTCCLSDPKTYMTGKHVNVLVLALIFLHCEPNCQELFWCHLYQFWSWFLGA